MAVIEDHINIPRGCSKKSFLENFLARTLCLDDLIASMPGVEDRSVEVLAIGAAFGSLACVTMMLRCYVRAWVVKCFGWDDASMLFSLVSLTSLSF